MVLEDGSVDVQTSIFLCTYSLLVLWVVLQVSITRTLLFSTLSPRCTSLFSIRYDLSFSYTPSFLLPLYSGSLRTTRNQHFFKM